MANSVRFHGRALALYTRMNFFAVDGYALRRVDTQANLIALNADYGYLDVIRYYQRLSDASSQDQHGEYPLRD